jgi:hypothetical protein
MQSDEKPRFRVTASKPKDNRLKRAALPFKKGQGITFMILEGEFVYASSSKQHSLFSMIRVSPAASTDEVEKKGRDFLTLPARSKLYRPRM